MFSLFLFLPGVLLQPTTKTTLRVSISVPALGTVEGIIFLFLFFALLCQQGSVGQGKSHTGDKPKF